MLDQFLRPFVKVLQQFVTVPEEDMLASMITYLEEENKTELSSILQVSKFIYSPQWEFSGIVS